MRGDDGSPVLRPNGTREQPRVRGDDTGSPRTSAHQLGNSPACAGTTSPICTSVSAACGTAPRARGRRLAQIADTAQRWEQPRVRGDDPLVSPARHPGAEQPRVRGDDAADQKTGKRRTGTAPRARGRQRARLGGAGSCGNSPACAGTTSCIARPACTGDRNSPACAGTTTPTQLAVGLAREQPRVRGDDGLTRLPCRSSARNSPACAGTTVRRLVVGPAIGGTAPRARGRPVVIVRCET